MRICHVITGLNVGGAELALCGLLETLGQPEQTVVVLGGTSALSARVERFAELHHLDMTAGRAGPLDFLRLRRLLLTNSIRPDVIHAWMYHANFMSALAAVNAGIPLMWGIHHSLSDLASEKRKTRAVIPDAASESSMDVGSSESLAKPKIQGSIGFRRWDVSNVTWLSFTYVRRYCSDQVYNAQIRRYRRLSSPHRG